MAVVAGFEVSVATPVEIVFEVNAGAETLVVVGMIRLGFMETRVVGSSGRTVPTVGNDSVLTVDVIGGGVGFGFGGMGFKANRTGFRVGRVGFEIDDSIGFGMRETEMCGTGIGFDRVVGFGVGGIGANEI